MAIFIPEMEQTVAAVLAPCKRMPCRTERGDCLFHLGTPFED